MIHMAIYIAIAEFYCPTATTGGLFFGALPSYIRTSFATLQDPFSWGHVPSMVYAGFI